MPSEICVHLTKKPGVYTVTQRGHLLATAHWKPGQNEATLFSLEECEIDRISAIIRDVRGRNDFKDSVSKVFDNRPISSYLFDIWDVQSRISSLESWDTPDSPLLARGRRLVERPRDIDRAKLACMHDTDVALLKSLGVV